MIRYLALFLCSGLMLVASALSSATHATEAATEASEVKDTTPHRPLLTAKSGSATKAEKIAIDSDSKARALFQAWRHFEKNNIAIEQATTAKIAIPSLKPVDSTRLSSPFGMRVHPISRRRAHHSGMDMPAPYGSPIYAAADGTIIHAHYSGGYGKMVEIAHSHDIRTRYGHMSAIQVKRGSVVRKGDIIGYVGSTGRSTGNHLHYEVRIAGIAVDPSSFFHQPAAVSIASQVAQNPRQNPSVEQEKQQEAIGGPEETE